MFRLNVAPVLLLILFSAHSSPACDTQSSFSVVSCGPYLAQDGNMYDSSRTIQVIIPNAAGCDSVMEIELSVKFMDVTLFQVGGSTLICNYKSPTATFYWVYCDSNYKLVYTGHTSTVKLPYAARYAVIVEDSGCMDTSDCLSTYPATGFRDMDIPELKVYPNPSKGIFIITCAEGEQLQCIRITDALGRTIYTARPPGGAFFEVILNAGSGHYWMQVETGNGRKFIPLQIGP